VSYRDSIGWISYPFRANVVRKRVIVPDWSKDSPSFNHAPDWSRGCIRGVQGVVKPETGFKRTPRLSARDKTRARSSRRQTFATPPKLASCTGFSQGASVQIIACAGMVRWTLLDRKHLWNAEANQLSDGQMIWIDRVSSSLIGKGRSLNRQISVQHLAVRRGLRKWRTQFVGSVVPCLTTSLPVSVT